MKMRLHHGSQVLFLLFAISALPAAATPSENFQHCAEYIRGSDDLSAYYPVLNDGRFDSQMIAELRNTGVTINYQQNSAKRMETVERRGLASRVVVEVQRDSRGRIETLTKSTFPLPSAAGVPMPNPTPAIKTTDTFGYIGEKCVPSRKVYVGPIYQSYLPIPVGSPPNVQRSEVEMFNINSCRLVIEFFERNKEAVHCKDELANQHLNEIAKTFVQPSTFPGKSYGSGTDSGCQQARSVHDFCLSTRGLSSAIRDKAVWQNPGPLAVPAGAASSAGAKQ